MGETAATGYPHDWPPVLVGRFLLQHAATRGDRAAVIANGRSHTYHELAQAGDQYQQAMLRAGLRGGDPVAVQMDFGFEALAVLLACSEAGLLYVPFNSDLPEARMLEICRRVSPRLLVTGPGAAVPSPALTGTVPLLALAHPVRLDISGSKPVRPRRGRPVLESDPTYVIFTSGSTGAPKGVVMSHRATTVAFRGIAAASDAHDRLASVSPIGFDFSLLDAAAALGRGKTLICVPRGVRAHPRLLLEYLLEHQVQQLHCVPALWALLLRHCGDRVGELGRHLKRTVVGGDEVPVALVNAIRAALPGIEVLHLYGQTESICCSFFPVPDPLPDHWQSLPLGDAYPGAELLLVDAQGEPIEAQGDVGELHLRSAALFDGYWHADDLTARAMAPDPRTPDSHARLYRTGDLAVRGPDGLFFVGRRDHQVQIYGNRVELEEVERCLAHAPGIAEVGVTDVRIGDKHLLVAVVSAHQGPAPTTAALQEHCGKRLPRYMVPTRFLSIEALPMIAAGKLDRDALAKFAATTLAQESADTEQPATVKGVVTP